MSDGIKLDTIVLVETPEGIDLQAEAVGVVARGLAYTLDFTLRAIVVLVVYLTLMWTGKGGQGISLIILFLLEWFYPVFFEIFRNGQTVGKKAMHIRVVNQDLTPIRFGASLTRNLLRAADFLPFCYLIGIISSVVTGKCQRLGDLAAGTIVIYADNEKTADSIALKEVKAITPKQMMPEDVQAAFIDLSVNRGKLSAARQAEIAEIIRLRIPEEYDDAVSYVRGVGKWYLGER